MLGHVSTLSMIFLQRDLSLPSRDDASNPFHHEAAFVIGVQTLVFDQVPDEGCRPTNAATKT